MCEKTKTQQDEIDKTLKKRKKESNNLGNNLWQTVSFQLLDQKTSYTLSNLGFLKKLVKSKDWYFKTLYSLQQQSNWPQTSQSHSIRLKEVDWDDQRTWILWLKQQGVTAV